MAKYIFRWDDISPFQDGQKFRKLVNLFEKYRISAVLGVIPENQDENIKFDDIPEQTFIAQLKELQAKGWEIAQHGFRHIKHSENGGILGLNQASEFAGRRFEDQSGDIRAGRNILERWGFEPVTFIPPWHSFDDNTLKALADNNFTVLSDGNELYPARIGALISLPVLFWSVPSRISTLNLLDSIYTICLHPQLTTDTDLEQIERFFKGIKPDVVTAKQLLDVKDQITNRTLKKKILESVFKVLYKKKA